MSGPFAGAASKVLSVGPSGVGSGSGVTVAIRQKRRASPILQPRCDTDPVPARQARRREFHSPRSDQLSLNLNLPDARFDARNWSSNCPAQLAHHSFTYFYAFGRVRHTHTFRLIGRRSASRGSGSTRSSSTFHK
jgi:hypothetical protein